MEPNILNYPNSQEGIDAYEADLAAYKREQNPLLGKETVDTIENVVGQVAQIPGITQGFQIIGGAAKWIDETMTQDQGIGGQLYRSYQTVKTTSEQRFGDLAENLGVDRRIGEFGGGELVDFVATAGAGTVAKRAKNVIDKLPPGGMSRQLATATSGVIDPTINVAQDVTNRVAQPLQIASDLKRGSDWQNTVRVLREGDNTRQIRDFLLKGPGGKIKRNNLLVTADELAANKGGVMDKLLERADAVSKAWDRYQKNGSAKAQRNLYDIASKNIFDSAELIYGKDSARSYLAKATNWLTNDEWHHVFGNKEAGEFILMQAAQDPLVAANIFKRMEVLGLNSSGVAQNIALMKKGRHTNWHDFMKAEGFEPKSPGKPLTTAGSTAPLDFADLSKALGEEIAAGRGDVNDIFKMLDLYADYNKWVKSKLPEYGAEIISDLPEGHGKALQIGGYKTKPRQRRKRS